MKRHLPESRSGSPHVEFKATSEDTYLASPHDFEDVGYFNPADLFENIAIAFPKLEELDLQKTHKKGEIHWQTTIPRSINQLTALRSCSLVGVAYHGEVPIEFGDLNLKQLDIFDTRLTFAAGIFTQLRSLGELQISHNQDLDVPSILNELTSQPDRRLSKVDISEQRGLDAIPLTISNLKNLKTLKLSHCGLTGPIVLGDFDLPQLEVLDLEDNQLVGSLPEAMTRLTSLISLNLKDNQLEDASELYKILGNLNELFILGNPEGFLISAMDSLNKSPESSFVSHPDESKLENFDLVHDSESLEPIIAHTTQEASEDPFVIRHLEAFEVWDRHDFGSEIMKNKINQVFQFMQELREHNCL
jgi:hypothetical protein